MRVQLAKVIGITMTVAVLHIKLTFLTSLSKLENHGSAVSISCENMELKMGCYGKTKNVRVGDEPFECSQTFLAGHSGQEI